MTQLSSNNESHCPACNNRNFKAIPFYDNDSLSVVYRSVGFHWRLCMVCGNGYPSKQATLPELQEYWNNNRIESDEHSISEEIWDERFENSKVFAHRTLSFITPYLNQNHKRFLDIGCGLGATIALFHEKGWDAEGVDPDPNIQFYHNKLGIKVVTGQIENVDQSSQFDVVSISHAIYFITEPQKFVQCVRERLTEGGLFHIVISDFLSSFSDNAPGIVHHWYPTSYSLIFLLEQEGFEVIATRSYKGSFMLLAKTSTKVKPKGQPMRAYIAHITHKWRYLYFGRPVRAIVSLVKKFLK